MSRLQVICVNFAMQSTAFMRLSVRKSKLLITDQYWNEEKDNYLDYLTGYDKDFSREVEWMTEEDATYPNKEVVCLLFQRLRKEIKNVRELINERNFVGLTELLELMMSLVYALLVYSNENQAKSILRHFPLMEKEMFWYVQEYMAENNLPNQLFTLHQEGNKTA